MNIYAHQVARARAEASGVRAGAFAVCARLRHVAGTQWGSKKYMNMKHLETMEQETLAV